MTLRQNGRAAVRGVWHGCSRWAKAHRYLGVMLLLIAVIGSYAFVGSAGKAGFPWPAYMHFYDQLAEGFRQGHLHISEDPHPDLLRQTNPYDPVHVKLWRSDLSLYRGKYYLYWGPLPALLQAGAKAALRIDHLVGDQYLVFSFFSLCMVFGSILIRRVARRAFVAIPPGLVLAGVLAFAYANPTTHLIASGGVYQAAIAGAQAFLLLGLLFGFSAVTHDASDQEPRRRLLLAGAAWGLALTCRVSVAPAVVLLGLATAWATGWARGGWRRLLQSGIWMALPVVLSCVGLLWYNKLRFDAWFDFGTAQQLTTWKYGFSSKYVWANLYSYALRPFESACEFPQVRPGWNPGPKVLPNWVTLPEGYYINEPLVGWLRVVPIAWAGAIALVVAVLEVWRRPRRHGEPALLARRRRTYVWCVACFALLGTVTGFPSLGLYLATMRYLGDVTNGLVLLGVMGAFTLYAYTSKPLLRRFVQASIVAGCAATAVLGLMLGYQGYTGHFKRHNPSLDARLVKALSTCPDASLRQLSLQR